MTTPWIAKGRTVFFFDRPKNITTKYCIPRTNLENINAIVIVLRARTVTEVSGFCGSQSVETEENPAMVAK